MTERPNAEPENLTQPQIMQPQAEIDASAREVNLDLQPAISARSLGADAWEAMRRSPLFWISASLIVIFVLMAIFPALFTNKDPYDCPLELAREAPSPDAWFGKDLLGCDVYARTIYGARASILVGVLTAFVTAVIGVGIGTAGGYVGRWVDTLLSRTADVFFAIPLLLGGILIMFTFPSTAETPYMVVVFKVVIAMAILGWPNIFRLMRSSVIQVNPLEYVQAARALGGSPWRVVTSHVVPNSMVPVIVVSTIDLGAYIATEATLSFLGIGLREPAISWGQAISDASGLGYIRAAPHMLIFPSVFLSLTVLAFIMMGEVVRDAMDPKLR